MEDLAYEIKTYGIEFLGAPSEREEVERTARVLLFSEAGKTLAGELHFLSAQRVWLQNDRIEREGHDRPVMVGHFPLESLSPMLEMLRFEKPIYLVWMEESARVCVRTFLEPVGEQEV
jgi:hypothetical protein